jgi:signal transduction histidine kinase
MLFPSTVQKKTWNILDKYGLVLSGVFIFAYYLWTVLDMYASPHSRRSFQGYFFQFDSLILLWLLLVAGFKLQQYKRKQKEEEDNHRRVALEYELQKMQLNLLDDVTTLLTDAINNPLAVISLSAGSIRERFASDDEILGFLDRIEGALKRMREVLTDFHKYETKKIMHPGPRYPSQVAGESKVHSPPE